MSLEDRVVQLEQQVAELKRVIQWTHATCDSCQQILNMNDKCKGCGRICCSKCDFYGDRDLSGYCTIECARANWQDVCEYNSGGYGPSKTHIAKIEALLAQKEADRALDDNNSDNN